MERRCLSSAGCCLVLLLGGCLRSGYDGPGNGVPATDSGLGDAAAAADSGLTDATPSTDSDATDVGLTKGYTETLAGGGAGEGFQDGPAAQALFYHPHGVLVAPGGVVYVAEWGNNVVRKIEKGVVSTFAGDGTWGSKDGPLASAQLAAPSSLGLDAAGRLYVAEGGGNKVRIIENGMVSTLAGTGNAGYKDGSAATAQFDSLEGMVVTAGGTVYLADWYNQRIRKIENGMVSTFAGDGTSASKDGPAALAQFNHPHGLALDSAGTTLYVAEFHGHLIRVIKGGTVSTLAGTGFPGDADGPVASAQLAYPTDVAVGPSGAIYVTDHTHRVRRIQGGVVSPVAGTGAPGYVDGPNAVAQFNIPEGLYVDATGLVYVAEWSGHRIRLVHP